MEIPRFAGMKDPTLCWDERSHASLGKQYIRKSDFVRACGFFILLKINDLWMGH
jgi:hypothetical protein